MLLLLLATGGMSQEAWAKVTYHILSLPISTKQLDGTDHQAGTLQNFRTNVRVEVLRCVSSTLTVGLPFEYKSPLVTTYHYYASDKITRSANPEQLYGYNNTQYYFYTINGSSANEDVPGNQLTAGDDCSDNIDIYVTYDYDPATSPIDLSTTMDEGTRLLSASKVYNIHLKDRMVVLNQVRQNRPGAVLDGYYTPEQLSSNDFEWIAKEGLNNSTGYRHFAFKFGGNDPYNVTVFTAFDKNYTYRGTGQANFYTEFKKDKDKYTQKDVYKEYRGASFFSLMGAEITANMWLSSEANIQWQESGTANNAVGKTVPGYYKGPNDNKSTLYEMSPIFNSFAILNHKSGEGWALAGSKMNHGTQNWQPRASDGLIQYMDYKDNGNNIIIVYKAEASACKVDVYEVKEYVFRVQTPFGNHVDVVGKWSDYAADETITADMVPDALKRKYVNFTGSFYADAAHNTAVTTFADAQTSCSKDASDRPIIYVGYEVVGAPFTAITAANKTGGYTTATWYELTDAASDGGKKIKWDATNTVYKNNGGASEYNKESEFAFIGDPYELRIINRQLTADASANRYVGSSSRTTGTDLTNNASDAGAGFKWEIPYDETLGSFTLREFGSTDAYWQWSTTEGNTIQYSTSASTRIKLMEIGKVNYTFKVVDLAGNIAIQATAELTPFTSLTGTGVCYSLIPSAIRSPFLADETVKFYDSYTDRNSDSKTDRTDWHNPSEQTALTELPGTASDIYVAYTTANLSSKNIKLLYNEQFNVKLNGEYIYWNSDSGDDQHKILSKANPTTAELESGAYLWHLRGRDPYSMRIDNVGYSATLGSPLPDISVTIYETAGDGTSHSESVKNGMFVRVDGGTWGDNKALTWTSDRDQASRFIAMMSNNVGVYEVLAATGTSDYYHIGRASTTGAETRIYANATYAHGADQLRFELAGTETIYYHLIDKSGNEIFTDEITSKNPRLTLPSEYVSPLVEEYYYYPTRAKATSDLSGDRITEIADDTNESGGARDDHVYVTYKVKEDFGFGTSYPRLLKFLNPLEEGYYLEDGADKLTGSKLKAIYPYCNGDGNLNIYGEKMRNEQMDGGSSTRPRWIWYFESATSDPYHVKIHSKSTISFGGGSHTTYLQTQAVHFNQDSDNANLQHIVTGANFPGISLQAATEYMVLGTTGRYKLVTTAKIAADLNGDGDTTDDGENERRTVTSFEQYWKTYNMIKQHLLGIDCDPSGTDPYKDENSTETSTFIVPTELRATLATALVTKDIGGSNWHSYDAIANAVRWNGYNAAGKRNSKLVERLEHWFQTFDMGNGEFDIEDADIPPVLVLLDRHGWEIMRKPLPTSSSDPQRDEKLAALRAFDSPMVKEYKFYNNASKDSDCHRYVLRMQNGAERDPIKLNGKQYTSTSLADLPPLTASGVISNGTINDQFVTYTVKEEYDSSYNPSTETASTFLVLQNDKYAQANGSTIDGKSVPASGLSAMIIDPDDTADSNSDGNIDDVNLWYVQPNRAIDTEMGYPATNTTPTYTDAQNGFDPYNVQLKNASTGMFFTTHMTQSVLSGGAYTGVYTGGGSTDVTLADACTSPVASPESYDHSTLQMTNQTFMAVQDENGNLQLMPRFDNTTRINVFTTLATPLTAPAGDHSGAQTTQLIRPLVFDYHIIDNNGNTALRYKAGGEYYPAIPEHFKSPLAKDFKFYKTLTDSNEDGVYEMATLADEITSSFAAAGIQESADIFIRYSYDEDLDIDNDNILQGRWMTISLGGNDVQASPGTDTGVSLYTGSKNASNQEWQWKFLASPSVETSPYYEAPDPYAVKLYNHNANRAADPTAEPNPMGTAIKVNGHDRFVLLSHPDGDYALAAAGDGLTYSFLNGGSMTTPSTTAASVEEDASFSTASTYDIADAERLIFNNDVTITYTYKVITNGGLLAASATQDESTAQSHNFTPYLPEAIQTPLLNQSDYQYYGTASESAGVYTVVPASELQSIYGLYDNVVYVRYNSYNELNSPYKVPNAKGTVDSHVARGSGSNDTSLGLNANLLYNIIWYNDEMMKSSDDGTAVQSESDQALQATTKFEWQLEGNDPYAIKIKSVGATSGETQKYIHESATPDACELSTTATTFMILNREGYDYGVLAKTGTPVVGSSASMLSGHGETLTTSDPTHFIIFALATYKVIYHLMIKPTGEDVRIPYRATSGDDLVMSYKITSGTTQRDLTSGSPAGTTYQLGTNLYSILTTGTRVIGDSLYCVDAGCISLGAKLEVPEALYRPNVVYEYFIEGVYNADGTESVADMNTKYRGLESETMGDDAGLLGKTVLINIVYSFNGDLETNQGEGFVTSVGQNKWYTFETSGSTPYLAHYTNAWGLQSMAGRATRFTNDYLWTPLGDAYGFKMYNRYMVKNSNQPNYVMTTTTIGNDIKLKMGEPDGSTIPYGNEIYELLASGLDGYFYVHPVINKSGTQYYVKRKDTSGDIDGDGQNDLDYAILSTTPTPWTFGLNESLFTPYYERAGYLGGLTTTAETGGKALYEEAAAEENPAKRLMALQKVVYNDANIIQYSPGHYRLHSQPGVSGISPVRYASGYLHKTELTAAAGSTPIPMHFYSRKNVSTTFEGDGGLASGFTETAATRGAIPVPATEYDPSTIFYFSGAATVAPTIPTSTISTQGLYVKGVQTDDDHGDAVMTATAGEATPFTLMDIGGGVFLIHDGSVPASRKYLHFSQDYTVGGDNKIYDLKYFHNSPTDDAKWCIEPADMQGLMVTTNSGGDGYFYTTFCAPFDVLLPDDDENATYYAYVCTVWDTEIIHPKKVGQFNTGDYAGNNKFIPAGTPAIIRTTDNSGSIKLSLPTSTPTTALSCVFSGKYLEQKLSTEITADDKVYAFGLPITGYGLDITSGSTNGDITNVIDKDQADTGVGFYLNANPDKELSEESGLWKPNNRYVLHNKIYYRTGGSGASARRRTSVANFIPVVFDDELAEEEGDEEQLPTDGRVYDMQGRCVAHRQTADDNSWKQLVAPGIYIVNGKKMLVGRR